MKPVGLVSGIATLLAATLAMSGDPAGQFNAKLSSDQQVLHVLNRLAFGPRPGDVDAVRRMGVKKWIQQQLEPARVPEDPVLEARLKTMPTLELPTWQLIENTQGPQLQLVGLTSVNMMQALPAEKMILLRSSIATQDQRREILKSLTAEQRAQVLQGLPEQAVADLPEYKREADAARQAQQEMIQRQAADQRRKLSPPLSELLTPDQLNVLRHGTDDEKTALITALDPETRTRLYRSVGAQGAQLLPAPYKRQAVLVANPQQGVVNELIEAKLQRAVLSNRQLEEVLVDFWFNHFNVSTNVPITKTALRMLLPSYERDAIRPYVLGRFRDMLLATARHPAMLMYLDNYQSQAPSPQQLQLAAAGSALRLPGINENYGREILELHTLGVGGGYTQQDVVNVARVFTGWTVFDPSRVGEFQFNPQYHDRAEKTVLGHTIARGGGEQEGVQVIDLLARHPSTAHHISQQLAQRFVADDPPPALVERMADTFLKTDGDLRAVMETMLLSKEFLSQGSWRSKVKSPLEMVASSLRALDADMTDTTAVAQRIADLGQPLYGKAEPTGYPVTSESWANSVGLIGRMNFASSLVAGQISGVQIEPSAIIKGDFRRSMVALTGVEASPESIAAVEKTAGDSAPAPALIATALIGSPDFQKR